MSFLCIGDVHITLENSQEVDLLEKGIVELVYKHNPDYVVIMGDVLHTHERLHTLALNHAYSFIRNIRKTTTNPVYVLVGNHDMISGCQFLNENHWMNGMKEWDNIIIVDKPTLLTFKDKEYIFMPYVPNGRFKEGLNDMDWKDVECIFAHQEFKGCKMGGIISENGDEWSDDLPNVVSGHIHRKQRLSPNIYYTGSSIQHAFGESEINVIPLVCFEHGKLVITEFDLNLPRKKIVYDEITNIKDVCLKEGDKVKLCLSGTTDEFKALKKTKKYKELIHQGVKIVHKPNKIDINGEEIKKMTENSDQANDFDTVLKTLLQNLNNNLVLDVYKKILH